MYEYRWRHLSVMVSQIIGNSTVYSNLQTKMSKLHVTGSLSYLWGKTLYPVYNYNNGSVITKKLP